MKKYNRSKIMKNAWASYRAINKYRGRNDAEVTFAECLRNAWAAEKKMVADREKEAAKGIVRMRYYEYKMNYSNCKTVDGSYDKRTKTIEVMTNVSRFSRTYNGGGICPLCHTYCYGDCTA